VSDWHRVCHIDDLPESMPIPTEVDDNEIILVRQGDQVFCLRDRCSHEEFPLNLGTVDGNRICCKAHGAEFDLATGRVLKAPALVPVKTYEVRIEGGEVFVSID